MEGHSRKGEGVRVVVGKAQGIKVGPGCRIGVDMEFGDEVVGGNALGIGGELVDLLGPL